MRWFTPLLVFGFLSAGAQLLTAQGLAGSDSVSCPPKDLSDVFRKKKTKEIAIKNSYLFITPVIGSSPATGFILGLAGQYSFRGTDPDDRYSLLSANAQVTTKKQALIQMKNNLLLADNRLFTSGDFRVFLYSQPTFGLGTDALNNSDSEGGIIIGNENVEPDSIAQDMRYNYFKFHQLAAYNFKGVFYLGGGIAIDIYNNINDQNLNLPAGDTTFHYAYSKLHGFDTASYTLHGLSANAIIDTRDNQINATKGIFVNLSYTFNPKLSSEQKTGARFGAELRYFKTMAVKKKNHTLAVWALTTIILNGEAPYLTLPALGWDQRSRSGRGYAQGTYRGQSFAYGEVEYRFPITCNELLGGVVFINATTTSDRDRGVKMFRYIQPALGAGLRLMLDKSSRTNLVLDYAWGRKSSGFYLNGGETF